MVIKLKDKEIEITRVPLGKYADILEALQGILAGLKLDEMQDLRGVTNEKFFQMIPALLGKHLPDIIRLLPLVTPLTEEEIQLLSLSEFTDIVYAVWVENDYSAVVEKLKKFGAQRNQQQAIPAASQPEN